MWAGVMGITGARRFASTGEPTRIEDVVDRHIDPVLRSFGELWG